MTWHPYTDGSVAAAQTSLRKCIEALEAHNVTMAAMHARIAQAQLDGARETEDELRKMEEGSDDDDE